MRSRALRLFFYAVGRGHASGLIRSKWHTLLHYMKLVLQKIEDQCAR